LIEDDLAFREPLVEMLASEGHTIMVADDGLAALAMLETRKPDLIITDILMPRMDGIETILAIARSGNTTPIIAMSGGRRRLTVDFVLESSNLAGVKVQLAKPFSRGELLQAIKEALNAPSSHASSGGSR
jgi:CheY-like chemotaxis protein